MAKNSVITKTLSLLLSLFMALTLIVINTNVRAEEVYDLNVEKTVKATLTNGVWVISGNGQIERNYWYNFKEAKKEGKLYPINLKVEKSVLLPNDSSELFKNVTGTIDIDSGINTENIENACFMFQNAEKANPDTTSWKTDNITNMSYMFADAKAANPNTTNWNTAKVKTMEHMFAGAVSANPDTKNWQTSNVVDMNGMFTGASNAQPNVGNWDVSNVKNFAAMFAGATKAQPDTSKWVISEEAEDMSGMFSSCYNVETIDMTCVADGGSLLPAINPTTAKDYKLKKIHLKTNAADQDITLTSGAALSVNYIVKVKEDANSNFKQVKNLMGEEKEFYTPGETAGKEISGYEILLEPYVAKQVTIHFNKDGGEGNMADVVKFAGETYTLPKCTFTAPTNKEFAGWDLNGKTKLEGETITLTEDITLKALWRDKSPTPVPPNPTPKPTPTPTPVPTPKPTPTPTPVPPTPTPVPTPTPTPVPPVNPNSPKLVLVDKLTLVPDNSLQKTGYRIENKTSNTIITIKDNKNNVLPYSLDKDGNILITVTSGLYNTSLKITISDPSLNQEITNVIKTGAKVETTKKQTKTTNKTHKVVNSSTK